MKNIIIILFLLASSLQAEDVKVNYTGGEFNATKYEKLKSAWTNGVLDIDIAVMLMNEIDEKSSYRNFDSSYLFESVMDTIDELDVASYIGFYSKLTKPEMYFSVFASRNIEAIS
jgi:hypothetical protein